MINRNLIIITILASTLLFSIQPVHSDPTSTPWPFIPPASLAATPNSTPSVYYLAGMLARVGNTSTPTPSPTDTPTPSPTPT